MAEQPTEKNLAWLVLRAANRTQARGSTIRLIVPRAPEVAEELGMELTVARLLRVQEYLQDRGYITPADLSLTWGAYTITPAGLEWLERELNEPHREEHGEAAQEPLRSRPETPLERPEGEEVWVDTTSSREGIERPEERNSWWRRVFGG